MREKEHAAARRPWKPLSEPVRADFSAPTGVRPPGSGAGAGEGPTQKCGAGGVDRYPQPADEPGRAGGRGDGGHRGGGSGAQTPGEWVGPRPEAGEAGVPLFAELGQG